MRRQLDSSRLRGAPALMPAAVAGSIALLLGTAPSPAMAAEGAAGQHRLPGSVPPASGTSIVRVPTAAAPATYTVQRGDTVYGIATRHGLRTADVLALNGLTSSSIIRPGQVLRLTGAAPAAPTPVAPVAAAGTYTVQKGDSLSGIAGRHGVTVKALFAATGLGWASIIYPGQKLTLPGGRTPTATPAAPAPAPPPRAAASGLYTVQKGDTLSSIARRNGVTVQILFAANGLGVDSIIYPGQKIALELPPAPAALPPKPIPTLDAEQRANAQLIIRVGRQLGVPERGLAIALGAAMQESSLRNLAAGDRDSIGLFQQRPSAGWGTPAEVGDPERSTRAFFGGRSDPNGWSTRGLLDIPGWQGMSFTQAAQAVQISAYPEHYGQWEPAALAWLASLG